MQAHDLSTSGKAVTGAHRIVVLCPPVLRPQVLGCHDFSDSPHDVGYHGHGSIAHAYSGFGCIIITLEAVSQLFRMAIEPIRGFNCQRSDLLHQKRKDLKIETGPSSAFSMRRRLVLDNHEANYLQSGTPYARSRSYPMKASSALSNLRRRIYVRTKSPQWS